MKGEKTETDKRGEEEEEEWSPGTGSSSGRCIGAESSGIDRWMKGETMGEGWTDRRREEKGKQSDARAPISQGFVIKGGRVASSVSVTLQVNKTNGTTEEKPPVGQSQLCVCALATPWKEGKET